MNTYALRNPTTSFCIMDITIVLNLIDQIERKMIELIEARVIKERWIVEDSIQEYENLPRWRKLFAYKPFPFNEGKFRRNQTYETFYFEKKRLSSIKAACLYSKTLYLGIEDVEFLHKFLA